MVYLFYYELRENRVLVYDRHGHPQMMPEAEHLRYLGQQALPSMSDEHSLQQAIAEVLEGLPIRFKNGGKEKLNFKAFPLGQETPAAAGGLAEICGTYRNHYTEAKGI